MKKQIIIALDVNSIEKANEIINQTKDLVWGYKVGMQLFYHCAVSNELFSLVKEIENLFLDLKFYDIPNTVAEAISSLKPLMPKFLTIHASGSRTMIKEACTARKNTWPAPGTGPKILAVTILTSISKDNWNYMFPGTEMEDGFVALLNESINSGADGVVCSGWEVGYVKHRFPHLLTVVPGIRPANLYDDQVRVITPKQAIERGADYIVIGRPIIEAKNYRTATLEIIDTL